MLRGPRRRERRQAPRPGRPARRRSRRPLGSVTRAGGDRRSSTSTRSPRTSASCSAASARSSCSARGPCPPLAASPRCLRCCCSPSSGAMLVASANDLVLLFFALELVSVPTYAMVAAGSNNSASQEAGLKYFFLGALSSAIMVYGFSFLYGAAGTTTLLGTIGGTSIAAGIQAHWPPAPSPGSASCWPCSAWPTRSPPSRCTSTSRTCTRAPPPPSPACSPSCPSSPAWSP